ncbi:hypothetical protein CASFOL_006659 [Castilleja foliolosa]|uniref:Uncharacterized protein n=1 Tax=Castilleja foliolosa TaxID=1961234 RepID=A0ABD3E723_9LAMI
MSKKSSSTDAAEFNGELHGELYSPDYAVHINTNDKLGKKEGQQGELYSPGSAMQTIVSSQQNKQSADKVKEEEEGQDCKKVKGVEITDELSKKPSSKL